MSAHGLLIFLKGWGKEIKCYYFCLNSHPQPTPKNKTMCCHISYNLIIIYKKKCSPVDAMIGTLRVYTTIHVQQQRK